MILLATLALAVAGLLGGRLLAARWERLAWWWRGAAGLVGSLWGLGVAWLLICAITGELPWQTTPGRALALALTLGWGLLLLLILARLLLMGPWPVLAVARTLLRQALALRATLVLVAMLLLVLAALPFSLDPEQPLRFRVQSFISHGLLVVTGMVGLLTILLACWTMAEAQRGRHLQLLVTRPVRRHEVLIGKWLGIVILDLVLLTVAGLGLYGLVVHQLARAPAGDGTGGQAPPLEVVRVREEVLCGRVACHPVEPPRLGALVEDRLQELRANRPEQIEQVGGEEAARRQLRGQLLSSWRSVGPMQQRTFRFTDLQVPVRRWLRYFEPLRAEAEAARAAGRPLPEVERETVQLRYRMQVSSPVPTEQVRVIVSFGEQRFYMDLAVDRVQVVPVPVDFIAADGTLAVTISNHLESNPTITFTPDEGLEILYRAGGFGGNLARGLLMAWLRVAFLAMLGLAAATCLSFPVAASLSLLILLGATLSGLLVEVEPSGPTTQAAPAISRALAWAGHGLGVVLQQYGRHDPVARLADGILIGWADVGRAALWLGGLWTGVTALVGAWILRSRELARVQV